MEDSLALPVTSVMLTQIQAICGASSDSAEVVRCNTEGLVVVWVPGTAGHSSKIVLRGIVYCPATHIRLFQAVYVAVLL